MFWMTITSGVFNTLLNGILLYHPLLEGPASSITAWLADNHGRWLAIASGVVIAVADVFAYMGGEVRTHSPTGDLMCACVCIHIMQRTTSNALAPSLKVHAPQIQLQIQSSW